MVVIEDLLGMDEILLDLRLLAPRDRQQPVEVVAHHRRFRRHRRHLAQLLELVGGLVAGLLRELGLLDLVLDLGELVAAFLVAELLLDRLHLLVEVVLALGLLHLALDPRADALLDLQDRDFAVHQAQHMLEPPGDGGRLQDRLLVRDLDREMGGDGIGELGVVVDLVNDAHDLRRNLLVELDVILELGDDRARHGLGLDLFAGLVGDDLGLGLVIFRAVAVADHAGALGALDQHLHRAVGQLEQLKHARERADLVDRAGRRIVVRRVLLGRQQNERVRAHDLFERLDRLLAADEQRDDHVRKHDDVAQRQHGIGTNLAWFRQCSRLGRGGHDSGVLFLLCPSCPCPLNAAQDRSASFRKGAHALRNLVRLQPGAAAGSSPAILGTLYSTLRRPTSH